MFTKNQKVIGIFKMADGSVHQIPMTVVDVKPENTCQIHDDKATVEIEVSWKPEAEKVLVPKAEPKVEFFGTYNPNENFWKRWQPPSPAMQDAIREYYERSWFDPVERVWNLYVPPVAFGYDFNETPYSSKIIAEVSKETLDFYNSFPKHFSYQKSTAMNEQKRRQLETELRYLFNKLGIDSDLNVPDHELAKTTAEYVQGFAARPARNFENGCMSPRPNFSKLVEESFEKDKSDRKERLRKLSEASTVVLNEAEAAKQGSCDGSYSGLSETLISIFRRIAEKTRIPSL